MLAPSGEVVDKIEARTAEAAETAVLRAGWVTTLSHAAWLGRELARATGGAAPERERNTAQEVTMYAQDDQDIEDPNDGTDEDEDSEDGEDEDEDDDEDDEG